MAPLSVSKGEKGEGDAVFAAWESRRRHLPFLRRNLRRAIEDLVGQGNHAKSAQRMGTVFSSRFKASRPREVESEEEADKLPRGAKRQKIRHSDAGESEGHYFQAKSEPLVNAISTGQHSLSTVNDATISVLARPLGFGIDSILPKISQKALRVDILGINHADSDSTEIAQNPTVLRSYRCQCIVAVFATENANDPELGEKFRYSKQGILRTSIQNGKYQADLSLPGPFMASAEELYVNQRNAYGIGDNYRLQVWLRSSDPQQNWPPLEVGPLVDSTKLGDIIKQANASYNDLWLFGWTNTILDPDQQDVDLDLSLGYGTRNKRSEKVETPYKIRVGVNWSLPSTLHSLHPHRQNSKATARITRSSNDTVASLAEAEQENLPFPEIESPQRARRRREDIPTYNLKVLSDIARGDQLTASLKRGPRSSMKGEENDGITVTYSLGRADATEFGLAQNSVITGLGCPFCSRAQESLAELQVHLRNQHSQFRFSLRRAQGPRLQFFVEIASKFGKLEQGRTVQLGKPATVFDIAKFIEGDRSWEMARHGPEHEKWPPHLANHFQPSSISTSPSNSRTSSPNTSIDERIDIYSKEISTKPGSVLRPSLAHKPRTTANNFQRPQKLRVPRTAKQLYHPITKRRLKPGELIDNSDDENDESWLNQKHRDIILDYTNITDPEKDYVIRWNPFITLLKLTCDAYMPQVVVRFVAENRLWFLCDQRRIQEFAKHAEALLLRGTIGFESWIECMEIIKKASEETSQEDIEEARRTEPVLWDPTKQRGYMDCVCGLPVNPLDALNQIKCTGSTCNDPHFHPRCVKDVVIDEQGLIYNYDELRTWKCAACTNANQGDGVPVYTGTLFPQ
ncbi:hypothetical protein PVAG01_07707 [Phlyctema vagabunda]|uniref:Polycomb protein VEFS-Box domain-containing protein n=1 Tax=Phlyctema vagabunda TaxID=108571 RepID=A0ABR4PD85_9HELO